ncbi:hypothetical protein ACHWQZ_G006637 [Mnemiopsis leidyi]
MFGSIWGNKPYRSTDMPLATEGDTEVSTEGGQEEKVDVVTKEPDSVETKDDTTNDGNVPKPEAPLQTEAASSWWDYTASYTNKLKQSAQTLQQSAQNFDYNKISTKIGETVNKEKMTSATNNLGSYFNSMYNGLKTSVETIQKEGIPLTDELLSDLGIQDIPMLSEFEDEQKKFVKMQQRRQGAAVPPWVGYNEEEKMKKQILSLSLDERNVLRDPPAGVDFVFEFESNMPVATAMLECDPKLNDLRFKLVPKVIKEDKFWRNYFYRVSLIKQSSQLASLEKSPTPEAGAAAEVALPSPGPDEPEYSFSPQDDEFISDHLSNYEDANEQELALNEDELKHLGLQKDVENKTEGKAEDEEWEAELARELQDFDMVEDAEGKIDTEGFEAELEEMLQNQ